MKSYKFILSILAVLLFCGSVQAQVKFKMQLLNDGVSYQVSLVPEISYRPPMNMTSTAQVTIKVPTGSFEITNIKNLQPNVEWEANSFTEAPAESSDFDYLSFGLASNGTEFLRYEEGLELPLFTFENGLECSGEIGLMDNSTDPFMPPNTAQKNVGNQITIAGADGDAYNGNLIKTSIPCGNFSTSVEEIDRSLVNFKLFPNPTTDFIQVSLNWNRPQEAATLSIFDLQGKEVFTKAVNINNGDNLQTIELNHLSPGNYLMEVSGTDWTLNSEQFMKLDK